MKREDVYDGYSEESKAYFEALDYGHDSIPYTPPAPKKQPLLRRAWLHWRVHWWSGVMSWHMDGRRCTWLSTGSCEACATYKKVINEVRSQMVSPDFPQARLQ